jgi:hypothetical protein
MQKFELTITGLQVMDPELATKKIATQNSLPCIEKCQWSKRANPRNAAAAAAASTLQSEEGGDLVPARGEGAGGNQPAGDALKLAGRVDFGGKRAPV